EGVDSLLCDKIARKHGPHEQYLRLLPDGDGYLFVEFGGATAAEAQEKAEQLLGRLRRADRPPTARMVTDPLQQRHLWDVRESGLGATAFVPGEPDTWPGWEDS